MQIIGRVEIIGDASSAVVYVRVRDLDGPASDWRHGLESTRKFHVTADADDVNQYLREVLIAVVEVL